MEIRGSDLQLNGDARGGMLLVYYKSDEISFYIKLINSSLSYNRGWVWQDCYLDWIYDISW